MNNVVIGCPVYKRAWILPTWFKFIEQQNYPLEHLGFIFEAGPDDEETIEILLNWHASHPEVQCFNVNVSSVEHRAHSQRSRNWSDRSRFQTMAQLRNSLLNFVRCLGPDRYFSLDSDILLEDPETIAVLVELTESEADAASPLMYMTPKTNHFPSVMTWGSGKRAFRDSYPIGERFQADVIMAAVMMNRKTYSTTQYAFHPQGEDLAWSLSCKDSGLRLYCASDIYCPHIMYEYMLEPYLTLGDTRRT